MPKDYWCNVCKEAGCADCFLLGSDHDVHQISKSNVIYKTLLNEYAKDVKCYQDQMGYWVRFRDHLTRQLSEFNIDCLEVNTTSNSRNGTMKKKYLIACYRLINRWKKMLIFTMNFV